MGVVGGIVMLSKIKRIFESVAMDSLTGVIVYGQFIPLDIL